MEMPNPFSGLDAEGKAYTMKPMLFHVSLFAVINSILHDRFFRSTDSSKVMPCGPFAALTCYVAVSSRQVSSLLAAPCEIFSFFKWLSNAAQDLVGFSKLIIREFVAETKQNPMLLVEALFFHSRCGRSSYLILIAVCNFVRTVVCLAAIARMLCVRVSTQACAWGNFPSVQPHEKEGNEGGARGA
jgi:hypothetical protein